MRTSEKPFMTTDIDTLCNIIDMSPDIIFTITPEGVIQYVNSSFCEILGYTKEEVIGMNIKQIAIDKDIYNACMLSVSQTGKCLDQETYFRKKSGEVVHVIKSVNAIFDENGKISTIIVNARDLTNVDMLNKELSTIKKHLEDRLMLIQQIFLNIDEAVAIIDRDGKYVEQNKAHEKLLGYKMEELYGKTPLIHMKKSDYERVLQEVKEKGYYNGEVSVKTKEGIHKDIELTVFPIRNDKGEITHYIGIKKDITEKKQSLYRDNLTGLPNRNKLIEDIRNSFNPKLVIINIDSFKEINDVYGFKIGDELLRELGKRLAKFVKEHGFNTYRIGGDEFAILIDNHYTRQDLEMFVNNLISFIQQEPFYIEDYELSIDVTVGIGISKEHSWHNIIEKADMALKYAKENKKHYYVYNENLEIHKRFMENLKWVKVLKNAINHKNLVVFYQPIFDNKSERILKYEALIRIKEGSNYISPFYFLDVAKKVKLYPYITQEVINKAFETSREYGVEISINLSIKDILNENITSEIFKQLRLGGTVTFELLESEGIENFEEVLNFIREVKKYNVKIAIDDFGSGYSNFWYLQKMNIDYLKIDSCLIKDIDKERESRIIVETIVDFSKKLGIKTVAEYVHSESVLNVVKSLGIDYSQGFFLGEPKPYLIK